jgi:hypothetical protein
LGELPKGGAEVTVAALDTGDWDRATLWIWGLAPGEKAAALRVPRPWLPGRLKEGAGLKGDVQTSHLEAECARALVLVRVRVLVLRSMWF